MRRCRHRRVTSVDPQKPPSFKGLDSCMFLYQIDRQKAIGAPQAKDRMLARPMEAGEWQYSIDRVVLYRTGALVTRAGALPAATTHRLELGILPASLELDSLRARVLGGSGSRVRAIRLGHESRQGRLCAFVDLERETVDTNVLLELDYFVHAARWAPGYSMRLRSQGDQAELEWHAIVAQDTGEDWSDVALALTTASFIVDGRSTAMGEPGGWRPHSAPDPTLFDDYDRHRQTAMDSQGGAPAPLSGVAVADHNAPATGAEFPETSWLDYDRLRLGAPSSVDRGVLRPLTVDPPTQSSGTETDAGPEPLPSGYRRPKSLRGVDYLYRAEQRGTFPGDGKFRVCAGARTEIGVRTTYVSVPSESSQVFRRLELINRATRALLEGPVDVYIDGVYAMSDGIELVPPQQSTTMELGAEPGIEVRREAISQSHALSGLLRGGRAVKRVVRVSVRSRLEQRAIVEVRESIPVPPRPASGVKVTIDSVEPPWGRYEPNRPELPGRYRWREKIEPQAEISLRAEYTVRTPARQTLARDTS